MKNLILFMSFLLALPFLAQEMEDETPQKSIEWGVKAGINMAFIPEVFDELKDNKSKIRFNGGVFMNFSLSDRFQIQPELEYSLRGTNALFIWEDDLFTEGIDVHGDLNLNYIVLPVMVRYLFNDNIYIGLGPYLGFLVKDYVEVYTASYVEEQFGVSAHEEGTLDEVADALRDAGYPLDADANKTDFGINIESGYVFPNNLGINLRYSQGISKILKGREEKIKGSPRNQVFFVGLDYRF